MNTRKYPRTLTEAFGPYTSQEIFVPSDRNDRLVVAGCLAAVACLAVIFAVWG